MPCVSVALIFKHALYNILLCTLMKDHFMWCEDVNIWTIRKAFTHTDMLFELTMSIMMTTSTSYTVHVDWSYKQWRDNTTHTSYCMLLVGSERLMFSVLKEVQRYCSNTITVESYRATLSGTQMNISVSRGYCHYMSCGLDIIKKHTVQGSNSSKHTHF